MGRLVTIVVIGLLALAVLPPLPGRSADNGCPTPVPTTTAMDGGPYVETSPLATPVVIATEHRLWFPIISSKR